MATNEILPFASTNTGTNLLTQAEYASDAQRTTGHQPGIARSKLENKALRQASLLASGLAEFIADYQANNVTDSLTPQNVADYLYAAIQASLAVTPPQFDNDTSLATTAFVQRALGNLHATYVTNNPVTLTASQVGQLIRLGGSSKTVTLPQASLCPDGSTFQIQHSGTDGFITVAAAAGDTLDPGYAAPTSVQLRLGESAVFTKLAEANAWAVYGGGFNLEYTMSLNRNLSNPGYAMLPGGLIAQWGQVYSTSPYSLITFPTSFPNACLSCVATPDYWSYDYATNLYVISQIAQLNVNGFRLRYSVNGDSNQIGEVTSGYSWYFAIGY